MGLFLTQSLLNNHRNDSTAEGTVEVIKTKSLALNQPMLGPICNRITYTYLKIAAGVEHDHGNRGVIGSCVPTSR